MTCPGCSKPLKFPARRAGARFEHRCGAKFRLRPDGHESDPGLPPSEDISGQLAPVSMKELVKGPALSDFIYHRCPGCKAKLKFPVKKRGVKFKHRCGAEFALSEDPDEEASSEAPGLPPSEDISGILDQVSAPKISYQRMYCPGCFRRLKFEPLFESLEVNHSCGTRFKLVADLAIEESTDGDPIRSEAVTPLGADPLPLVLPEGPPKAAKPPPPSNSGTRAAAGGKKRRRPPLVRSSGSQGLILVATGFLVLIALAALAYKFARPAENPITAGGNSSNTAPLGPTPPLDPKKPARDEDELDFSGPRRVPQALPRVTEEAPDWWRERQRDFDQGAFRFGETASEGPSEAAPPEEAPTVAPKTDWRERFRGAAEAYAKQKTERERLVQDLAAIMGESLVQAKESLAAGARILEYYDEHRKMIAGEAALKAALHQHRQLYMQMAMALATGPGQFSELAKLCADWGLKDEKAKLDALLAGLKPANAAAAAMQVRENARQQRDENRREVEAFIDARLADARDSLTGTIDWMAEQGYAPSEAKLRIARLVAALGMPEDKSRPVLDRMDAIATKNVDDKERAKLARDFDARLSKLVDPICRKLGEAANRLVRCGMPGLGFDAFQALLKLDPENIGAHKGLGDVKIADKWYRAYEAKLYREGLIWDDELAWIRMDDLDRYDNGEVFDFQSKEWLTFEAANQRHSTPSNFWKIESEHFVLHSTADLDLTARVLKRLEAVFLQAFRQYDLFFPGDMGARFIFGAGKLDKKLVVYFYRSRDQFVSHAQPPTDWAAGFYDSGRAASFFYGDGKRVDFSTLQHELIHQILGEFSPGHAPPWLAEGAAVYLEDAFFDGELLTLGTISDHDRVMTYLRNLRSSVDEHSFREMLAFDTSAKWDSGDISQNYRGAGALVYFLMNFDGGRFRGDFIEMLRDSYNGAIKPVETYFGLSLDSLDQLMDRFYKNVEIVPSAKR